VRRFDDWHIRPTSASRTNGNSPSEARRIPSVFLPTPSALSNTPAAKMRQTEQNLTQFNKN